MASAFYGAMAVKANGVLDIFLFLKIHNVVGFSHLAYFGKFIGVIKI